MKNYGIILMFLCSFLYSNAQEVFVPQNLTFKNTEILKHRWKASWIAHPTASQVEYGVFYFRKKFQLSSVPDSFIVYVSADNRYKLYVNGKYITLGPARGDELNWRYETIDIAAYLQQGENLIAAEVVNFGNDRPLAQHTFQTAFILQAENNDELSTGIGEWKVVQNMAYHPVFISTKTVNGFFAAGPCDSIQGEHYPWNWNMPGFNDDEWETAKMVYADKSKEPYGAGREYIYGVGLHLVPRKIPLLEQKKERFNGVVKTNYSGKQNDAFISGKPTVVKKNSKVTFLLDQSYLTIGYPQLFLSKGKGSKIKITYAESLWNKDNTKGNRNVVEGKEMRGYYDVYLPDGGNNRLYQPLWLRTFRYVQLDIETGNEDLVLNDYYNIFTAYPFSQKAKFEINDSKLEQIWNISWRTARLCAGETYFDCPYYEQLQYIGDTRIQSLISLYITGDDRLMRNAIELFNSSRTSDGLTLSRYPSYYAQIIPTFSLMWINMIHDYYMYRGDSVFIAQFSQGIKDVLNWFEERIDSSGLPGSIGWWNYTDWTPGFEMGMPNGTDEGHSALMALQYIFSLQHASALFNYLEQPYFAEKYAKQAKLLQKAVVQNCYDENRKLIAETPDKKIFSQHTTIFAIITNTIEPDKQAEALKRALADNDIIKPTIYFKFYLFRAMQKAGLGDMYLDNLQAWYNMLEQGLTTFAETDVNPRSECHAWSASPLFDFFHTVAGIQPASPGFETILIEPNFGKLTTIDAKFPHPKGEVSVHLIKEKNNKMTGKIMLPEELKGTFKYRGNEIKLKGGEQNVNLKF